MADKYSYDDFVCSDCIEDAALKALVSSEGALAACALCGKTAPAVTISELADLIYPALREFYALAPQYYGASGGDDLSWVLQDALGQYLDCNDTLVNAVCDADPADVRHGDEPFFTLEDTYRNRRISLNDQYARWEQIKADLKHRRRFFNESAREFFDWLFEHLDDLQSPAEPNKSGSHAEPLSVVRILPAKTIIHRARLCDSIGELTLFLRHLPRELGAPPPEKALAGRMNPQGVPTFYGALDETTAIAEVRPSIGGMVLAARFSTTRRLRVVDFQRLDHAYYSQPLSYFQQDAAVQFQRSEFLRRLHTLIAEPVLPHRNDDYLITQYMAEYLAHVRKPPFDGVLFRSTQRASGVNVVLFPQPAGGSHSTFAVRHAKGSAKLHRANGVEYKTEELEFQLLRDGAWLSKEPPDDE